MQIEKILSRLDGVIKTNGQYMANCPAHSDKDPSLAIKESENKILIHCFAGCSALEVLEAIGLSVTDLYTDTPTHHKKRPIKSSYRIRPPVEKITPDSYYNTVIAIAKSDVYRGTQLNPVDLQTTQEAMDYFESRKKDSHIKSKNLPDKLSDYRNMKLQGIRLTQEQVEHEQQLLMERRT